MTLAAKDLTIDLQEMEAWRRRLTVKVPKGAVEEERVAQLKSLSRRLKLPGFRKGRVPKHMIQKRYGHAVEREVLDRVVTEAYKTAIASTEMQPISEGELEEIQHEPGQDLMFTISFDVQPEFGIERVGGFTVKRPQIEVTDENVSQAIERLRHQNGAWKPAETGAPEEGDLVSVEISRLDDDPGEPQPYEFMLGQGDAIPEVENAIRTLEPGGEGDFTVTFPDDFPNEERRGAQERLHITLKARRVLELPEVTDEFAKSVGDFEDLEALQARIREDMGEEAKERITRELRGQLLDHVVEANRFDVPASMIDRYLDSILGSMEGVPDEKAEEARGSLRPEAERQVRRMLVIERIADQRDLHATEEDIDAKVEEIAEKTGTSPAEVYGRLQKAGRIGALERELTEQRVFELLESESEIVDAD